LIAALSCGIEALMFGSLMMLASGRLASSPSSARASPTRWSSVEVVGEGRQDPAGQRDVPVSTSTPAAPANASMIGSSESVASAGASSV
jgi:hypothetical protein